MHKDFNKKDTANTVMSGVGGEVTEADQIFSEIRKTGEKKATQRRQRRKATRDREQKKLEAGAHIVAKATSGSAVVLLDDDVGEGSD